MQYFTHQHAEAGTSAVIFSVAWKCERQTVCTSTERKICMPVHIRKLMAMQMSQACDELIGSRNLLIRITGRNQFCVVSKGCIFYLFSIVTSAKTILCFPTPPSPSQAEVQPKVMKFVHHDNHPSWKHCGCPHLFHV